MFFSFLLEQMAENGGNPVNFGQNFFAFFLKNDCNFMDFYVY